MTRCYKCKYSNRVETKAQWIKEQECYLEFEHEPTEKEIYENSLWQVEYEIKSGDLIPV